MAPSIWAAGTSSSRCLDGARRNQQHWTWPPPCLRLRDPSPQPGVSYRTRAALCLKLVSSGLARRGLWLRWPPALLCAQFGSPPVRYIPARKVGAASVQPAPPAAASRPSPAGKAGTPAGEAGMGGWGEARRSPGPRGRGRRGVPRAWVRGLSPRAGDVGAAHRRSQAGEVAQDRRA